MEKLLKKLAKKVVPEIATQKYQTARRTATSVQSCEDRLETVETKVDVITENTATTTVRIEALQQQLHDLRLGPLALNGESIIGKVVRLEALLGEVEHYQPVYGFPQLVNTPARDTADRCQHILSALDGNVAGLNVLDVGSSLGYVSMFLADNGANVTGWEYNPNNLEVAQITADIQGNSASFVYKTLNMSTVESLNTADYDVTLVLSVFHHVIAEHGLEYVQKMVAKLFEVSPIMIVELAEKGEDPTLSWDSAQPDDPLDIFANVDVEIRTLASFGTHLSGKKRNVYLVSKSAFKVGNTFYPVETTSFRPYDDSPVHDESFVRTYFTGSDVFIKRYTLDEKIGDNHKQIVNELSFYLNYGPQLETVVPKLIDFEVKNTEVSLVLERVPGGLLDHLNAANADIDLDTLASDLVDALETMESIGLHHNDIRSWNVIISNQRAQLVDFGLAGAKPTENNAIALLWLLASIVENQREPYEQNKSTLPEKKLFTTPTTLSLYEAIDANRNATFADLKLTYQQ